jgi:hypothetical protein
MYPRTSRAPSDHRSDDAALMPKVAPLPVSAGGARYRTLGRHVQAPPRDWLWSPERAHPALIDRATWDQAHKIGKKHATAATPTLNPAPAPPGGSIPTDPAAAAGNAAAAWPDAGTGPRAQSNYYRCPHDPRNPRHAAATPAPATRPPSKPPKKSWTASSETSSTPTSSGPAAPPWSPDGSGHPSPGTTPVTQADADAGRDATRAALALRLKQNETAKKAQITADEHLPEDDPDAAAEMRTRIFDWFAELRAERERLPSPARRPRRHHTPARRNQPARPAPHSRQPPVARR